MVEVEVVGQKKRKIRSDKKRDIKPTILKELKVCIEQLSYITNTPVKDIVSTICENGLKSRVVIEYLSPYFRRDYQFTNTFFLGDLDRESLQRKYQDGEKSRITTRVTQEVYEKIKQLSDALDVTPSKATALLLDASIRNTNILNAYVKAYLKENVDNGRIKELKLVLKYINKNNPYNESISWFTLLTIIFDEIKGSTENVKQTINNWLDKYNKT
ncbi:hypothetical protein MKX83_24130 [Cytobacillus sp. FSL M8-0252]|uniref:hypothetical protein n=1 Tax=Cytobacillus sp. FSL M8-0252 TaxID=2921621 RepID=UPI0030F9224C